MALQTAQNQIGSNIFKTWLIMFFFSLFVMAVVYVFARGFGFDNISGLTFMGFAFILAGIMNLVSYYNSDKMVMAISGAKRIEKKDNPLLFRTVENLSIAAGLPTPAIYIIQDSAPNAFATGRDPKHSAVAFTTGILSKLTKSELEGVVAHELSHIGNRDTLLMTVVSILVGLIALLADWYMHATIWGGRDNDNRGGLFIILAIVAAVLAPIIATLIQLALSRKREYLADASGAYLTRDPAHLASALQKISSDKEPLEVANRATAHLYIVNPLKGEQVRSFMAGLFNTHPPIKDRVERLGQMQGQIQ